MNKLQSHIVLSTIAFLATNVFFVLGLLIDSNIVQDQIVTGLGFHTFFLISNSALLIISMASIGFKEFGDRLLVWGCSNVLRFLLVILMSVLIFFVAMITLLSIHYFLTESISVTNSVLAVLTSKYFISLTFYFLLISIMMFFISNLERRTGSVIRLMALSMGQVLNPKLTERGFMFIDLNGATAKAEKMQSQSYAKLLRDCFRMLNELVELCPFEIYQYVGDEAVITWKSDIDNADLLALHLFSDFKAYLKESAHKFHEEYGFVPKFKCAIHSGEVVQSEIGKDIKHLVYHGDVLNTTSRLLAQCTDDTDMILSKPSVKNILRLQQDYLLEQIIFKNLKGKEKEVFAYKVVEQKQDHSVQKAKKQLFSETIMTNSQNYQLTKNP
ncbi:MAG: adenylate/guanylate cyclase domain-containing protein [Bacteroidota bacterium]